MEHGPQHLTLAPHTLAVFDEACDAVEVDPDAVRAGEEMVSIEDCGKSLLAVVAPEAEVPSSHRRQAARLAGRMWFEEALRQVQRAGHAAEKQAEAVGVLEVMKRQGSEKPLSRSLSTMPADEYELVWHTWEIERALTYLMLRSVDHVSENLEDYL
jgi:hypothetical protein